MFFGGRGYPNQLDLSRHFSEDASPQGSKLSLSTNEGLCDTPKRVRNRLFLVPQHAVFVWFVLNDDAGTLDRSQIQKGWEEKIIATGRYTHGRGRFVHYEDMTAAEYLDSDTLDLERLSPEPIETEDADELTLE